MSHVTHTNESCRTYEWVMSHIWISHGTCVRDLESDGAFSDAVEGMPTAIWKRKRDLRYANHVKRALYACWKSPICMSKEPYMHVERALQGVLWMRPCCDTHCHLKRAILACIIVIRRALHPYQMSFTCMSKEPYMHVERALCASQKSPICMCKEPYTHIKWALRVCQKSPSKRPMKYQSTTI